VDLEEAWNETASLIGYDPDPEADVRLGVTYHGPLDNRPWVAWCQLPGREREGWGDTPVNALRALRRAVAEEVGWWTITESDREGHGP
jgi:hypothetical protein